MKEVRIMKIRLLLTIGFLAAAAAAVAGQEFDASERADRWQKFNRNNFHTVNFARTRLTKARIAKLDPNGAVDDFALLRGVVFGKRGRIFKERSIQEYLDKQPWYKPNANFSNKMLNAVERANLDLIRLTEAEKHDFIEPGDMRIWQAKPIVEDKLRGYTASELTILLAEIEAIHGKRFDDQPWLQKYFEERYWYIPDPMYSPTRLSAIEKQNIETLLAEKSKGRNTAISIGDMDNFQDVALTEDMLKGLTMMELRIIRNEFWARRGLKFGLPGIRQYFEWRDWYRPLKDQRRVKLSDIEKANVELILAYEGKLRERLSTEELPDDFAESMFTEDLRILRNELYARHGRVFKDPVLQKYFESQPWYKADPEFKDEMLSTIEFKNLAKLKAAEEMAISKFSAAEG
jgi:hypothetical protein